MVIFQALLHHIQHLPIDFQHLHRRSYLLSWHRATRSAVRYFGHRRYAWSYCLHHWLRHRPYVLEPTVRDPTVREDHGLHLVFTRFRLPPSADSTRQEPRRTPPAPFPRGLCRLSASGHRRRESRGHVDTAGSRGCHWPVGLVIRLRTYLWSTNGRLRSLSRRLDLDHVDLALALGRIARLAGTDAPGNVCTSVSTPRLIQGLVLTRSRILYRRAVRLRRLTGNPNLKSQGELDGAHMTLGELARMTLVRPFVLTLREPIVFFLNLYIALTYGETSLVVRQDCVLNGFQVSFISSSHRSTSFLSRCMVST